MNKLLTGLLIVSLALLAGCSQATQTPATPSEPAAPGADQEPTEPAQPDVGDDSQKDVRTIQMTGENYDFYVDGEQNPTINVEQGQTVRIEFSSTEGFHDFVVDEFDAATQQVRPDDGVTVVEFTADQAGEFAYYCSVGSHRENGMVGTLLVE